MSTLDHLETYAKLYAAFERALAEVGAVELSGPVMHRCSRK